jgi:hypothetical protein
MHRLALQKHKQHPAFSAVPHHQPIQINYTTQNPIQKMFHESK